MLKEKRYSPYLSIYKPQISSIISILQRVTGILILLSLLCIIVLIELVDYYLMDYSYYFFYFCILKGRYFIVNILFIFILVLIIYHLYFLPNLLLKLKSLLGELNNYREIALKKMFYMNILTIGIGMLVGISIVFFILFI